MVVRTSVDIYTENVRTVTTINSEEFGKVLVVAVGAMFVGSIVFTTTQGCVQRMDEHGYFAFGGSTILLLFQSGQIEFDKDLIDNSEKCLETIIQVGSSIGRKL
jgi:phosphatidylserine decarboxylase